MALAECQRTQRVMLSDTNCSLILSGWRLSQSPKHSIMRPVAEREGMGREAETTSWVMKFWRFLSCVYLFILLLCTNYLRIISPAPPLTHRTYCLWGCLGLFVGKNVYGWGWNMGSGGCPACIVHKVDFEITAMGLKSKLLGQAEITT